MRHLTSLTLVWGALLLANALGSKAQAAQALPLEEAVRQAIAAAPELEQGRQELARAQLQLAQAQGDRLSYGAELSLGNRFGISGIAGPTGTQSTNAPLANATMMANWPAFTGWRLEKGIELAEAGVRQAQARLDEGTQDLALKTTEAYWQAARAVLGLRVSQFAIAKAKTAQGMARVLVAAGTRHGTEVDRATLALLEQESEGIRAQETEARTRIELTRLLRRPVMEGEALVAQGEPELVWRFANTMPIPVEKAWEEAKAHRPDLHLAQAQNASALAQIGVAQSQRWPQLNAVTAYQHGNNPFIATSQNRSVLNTFVGTFDVRLNLSYQLFDHGAIARNIEAAQRAFDAVVASGTAMELRAKAEVEDALVQQKAAADRLRLARQSAQLSEKILKYMEVRYQLGFVLLTEFNESWLSVVNAKRRAGDAAVDWRLAEARLARAMGRLPNGGMR